MTDTEPKPYRPCSLHFQLMTDILHDLESSLLYHVRQQYYNPYPQEIQTLLELQEMCESFHRAIKEARKISKMK